jgi:hypothetical protein
MLPFCLVDPYERFFFSVESSLNKEKYKLADKLIFINILIFVLYFIMNFGRHNAFAVYLFVHLSICPHLAFPTVTGQTAGQISMKLQRCDQYHP